MNKELEMALIDRDFIFLRNFGLLCTAGLQGFRFGD